MTAVSLLARIILPRPGEPLDVRKLYLEESTTNARRAHATTRTSLQIGAESEVSRLTAGPPGIPANRLALLRRVYLEALADPGFRAQARKMDAPVDPSGGRHVQEVIDQALQLPPSTLTLLRQAVRARS